MEQEEKGLAILSYIGILVLVPLFAAKTSFARFHANQGLLLLILDVALGTVTGVSKAALWWLPFSNYITAGLGTITGLTIAFFAIFGIISAARGEEKELPIIGGIRLIR